MGILPPTLLLHFCSMCWRYQALGLGDKVLWTIPLTPAFFLSLVKSLPLWVHPRSVCPPKSVHWFQLLDSSSLGAGEGRAPWGEVRVSFSVCVYAVALQGTPWNPKRRRKMLQGMSFAFSISAAPSGKLTFQEGKIWRSYCRGIR